MPENKKKVKNIVIFSMSIYNNNSTADKYDTENDEFSAVCEHTNETALKYIDWKLKKEGQKIDGVYTFLTDKAKDSTFSRFCKVFEDYPFHIDSVPLDDKGFLKNSFKSICDMFDRIRAYIDEGREKNENVVIHFDMTGGMRNSAVLMLSLMQMFKYAGAEIGMILYSNYFTKKIEKSNDLIDLFTLISGANEFISFGSVDQIKYYFNNRENLSDELNSLLEQMERFSETMKICAEYRYINQALIFLGSAIEKYEKFLHSQRSRNISEQENFFAKLLQNIKNEYAPVMPDNNNGSDKLEIIKWCVKHGFLQQSLTFYTEWLPDYIKETGLITVRKSEISRIKKYDKNQNWIKCLLRSYKPKEYEEEESLGRNLTRRDINELLKRAQSLTGKESADEDIISELKRVKNLVKGRNEKFEDFIDKLINLDSEEKLFVKIAEMPIDNPIRFVMEKSCPSTAYSFEQYLNKRIQKEKNPQIAVIKSIPSIKKSDFGGFFKLGEAEDAAASSSVKISNKALKRQKVLDYCHRNNIVQTVLKKKKFLDFVSSYNQCVGEIRNKMNHASESIASKERNVDIGKMIIDSVSLLERNK